MRLQAEDWNGTDWNKNDTVLMIETGRSRATVTYWRHRVGHKSLDKGKHSKGTGPRQITKDRIDSTDFASEFDRDIATKFDISRERARQLRKLSGGRAHSKKAPRPNMVEATTIIQMHRKELDGVTADNVKARFNLTLSRVSISQLLRKFGVKKPSLAKLSPWNQVNWNLPNHLIAEIWIPDNRIGKIRVAQQRKVLRKPRAKWDARLGKLPIPWIVDREREKATKWRESTKDKS